MLAAHRAANAEGVHWMIRDRPESTADHDHDHKPEATPTTG